MKIDEYQVNAISTAVYPQKYSLIYPTIGLAGEAGEAADKLAELILGNWDSEKQKDIVFELGDVMWYLATVSNDINVSLSDCICIALGEHYDTFIDAQDHSVRVTTYNVETEVAYPALKLIGAIGKVSELVKKYVRDDDEVLSEIRKNKIACAVGETYQFLSCLAFDLNIEIELCAEKNIEKLFSRQKRNVVHGDGDNR